MFVAAYSGRYSMVVLQKYAGDFFRYEKGAASATLELDQIA